MTADSVNDTNSTNSNSSADSDPLRDGLVLLCARLERPTSVSQLGDGLPLVQGKLPLAGPTRATPRGCQRAGDVAPAGRSPDTLLPALLLLDDGSTLLLETLDDASAEVAIPETGGGIQTLSRETLEARYAGLAVFARPRHRHDDRAEGFAKATPEHWLKGPLRACWPAYAEVGMAALAANLLAISTALFAMQVYDRVVPNAAFDTLWVLASGVALAVVLEFRAQGATRPPARGDRQASRSHPPRACSPSDPAQAGRPNPPPPCLHQPGARVRIGARVLHLGHRRGDQ
ncbi:hypothetical protein [Salinicola tamaricis]|uniref:hypothetical protein n=1 Tax=Salinicola tamaricis TaxID=1771309 RepID=UPI001A9238A8|nr:hypothetical protein [Salinicola tamaricis]